MVAMLGIILGVVFSIISSTVDFSIFSDVLPIADQWCC
jgi:hypothetical protein